MIIYCAGPIRGELKYQKFYKEIVEFLTLRHHTPLSELHPDFKASIPLNDKQIFTRDVKWLSRSNIVIAEVSGPSLGVGFEIAYALYHLKIPVLAVAHQDAKNISAMISGCDSKLLTVSRYDHVEDLQKILSNFIEDIK